jgi:hypothetical protein
LGVPQRETWNDLESIQQETLDDLEGGNYLKNLDDLEEDNRLGSLDDLEEVTYVDLEGHFVDQGRNDHHDS